MTRRAGLKSFLVGLTFAAVMGLGLKLSLADESAATAPEPSATADVDQLAARMKTNLDVYQSVRDQALAAYAKLHPSPQPYDADAKHLIRLAAYLWVWDDFYREGLWKMAVDDAVRAFRAGARDPLLLALQAIHLIGSNDAAKGLDAQDVDAMANLLAGTDYPMGFKFWFYRSDAKNLVALKTKLQLQNPKTEAMAAGAVEKAAKAYGELIKIHLDHDLLFEQGRTFYHDLQADGDSLQAAQAIVDQSFAQEDPANVVRQEMQGYYCITYAWTARGTGNADKVTEDGWTLFKQRLQSADDVLEKAYADHPEVGAISREMLTVELGQGQGRDRMELWFGRAIQADPDDFDAYHAKAYYLAPEWYGSVDDLWNFGVECANTKKWPAKIPMVLVDSLVSHLWKTHPEYLTDSDKWQVVESTFRGYLDQFPRSNYYRSIFARCAVIGGHWSVAEEQFKILGDDWDRVVFPGTRYPEMKALADKNSAAAK